MASLTVVDSQGRPADTIEAADAIFAAPVKPHVMRICINSYLANQRRGSSSTKTRSTVRGGGRKPFRQKGTGRARQGTIRAPHMRGGAVAFGPHPRSWRQKLNRKVKRQGLTSALTTLVTDGALHVIKDFGLTEPKTKAMVALLERLGLAKGKTLILLHNADDRSVALSARNIPTVTVGSVDEINIFDLLTHDHVLTTPGAIKRIEDLLGQ